MRYPNSFLWGASTSAFQVEGHLNGPSEPENNWGAWERQGLARRTARGADFWNLWREDLGRARSLGLSALRLGVEWARLQPQPTALLEPVALARYVEMLVTLRELELEPVVTLHHFTHPAWLGGDAWLSRDTPRRFAAFVRTLVDALARAMSERHVEPVRHYVTVNEPNALALATYVLGVFPRGLAKLGRRSFLTAMNHLMLAHLYAYRATHAVYQELNLERPVVTFNPWACSAYSYDRMLFDLLRPSTRDTGGSRAQWRESGLNRGLDKGVDKFFEWLLPSDAFRELASALGRHEDAVDSVAFDYYGPFLSEYVGARGLKVHPWEWPTSPARFSDYLLARTRGHEDLPVFVMENGIGTPGHGPEAGRRPDQLLREVALEQAIHALDESLSQGIDVQGYFHWSLIDNYEWGGFDARFGLYHVDYGPRAVRTAKPAVARFQSLIWERRLA
ncbi:MAG: hypothetical protein AUK47_10915 [Deltaproteobacteria bacterium CG2_30_63_29]|nr:MAG: hypothetical protein AUK47_10915 [Deltaproteobacteria bacterium CG2_30_63_29]PIV98151.1 MAG: hypothetical protein COW42_16340 [Deltaproteobacteria bacterium CG17_big_fil_post_rev_8_21_14_2_50_63_7]